MTQNILVVGADGTIGSALVNHLEQLGYSVYQTTRNNNSLNSRRFFLDLAEPASNWSLPTDVCITFICAAETSTQLCAKNPQKTRLINVDRTEALAKQLSSLGSKIVFFSTNQVFNGSCPYVKADEPINPQTEYGRQKAGAEKRLLALGEKVTILRLTKVLSRKDKLLNQWKSSLQHNKIIRPFSDMVLAPVSLVTVIELLVRLLTINVGGILQISGNEDVTYEAVARHLARQIGASPDLVQPTSLRESDPSLEYLPRHTTLDTSKVRRLLSIELPDVWFVLDQVLKET